MELLRLNKNNLIESSILQILLSTNAANIKQQSHSYIK
jgi:hypothetical protein